MDISKTVNSLKVSTSDIIPIIDISKHTPLKGSIAYNKNDDLLYYATGTEWLLMGGLGLTGSNYSDYIFWNDTTSKWEVDGNTVHIGSSAGQTNQSFNAVAIGTYAGQTGQATNAVAIGADAGRTDQANSAVAIGAFAGYTGQAVSAVAIGKQAGQTGQASNAVAIGNQAGQTDQGESSIAIGNQAGSTFANSIVLNASGSQLNSSSSSGFFVNPIRNITNATVLTYNVNTSEITYSDGKTFVIPHPINKDKHLVHACLEGPEAGIYYRGLSKIENSRFTMIELPEYVKHIGKDFTVQITQLGDENTANVGLLASMVIDGKFKVSYPSSTKETLPSVEFCWHVYGKRGDVEVEPLVSSVKVNGSGPYKWLSS